MKSIFSNVNYESDVPDSMKVFFSNWENFDNSFLVDAEKKKASVYLYGPTGSGKTHIAKAVESHINEKTGMENFCLFVNYTNMISFISSKENNVYDYSRHLGLLIIDDLGARAPNDYSIDILYSILNYRYEHMMPTLITSNLDVNGIAQIFGDRISSRIDRMSVICKHE